jgi:molecular chaperone DnaK
LGGLKPLPSGSHQFEVKFDIDVNGVITASAKDVLTKKMVMTRVSMKGDFSRADMSRMIESTKKLFEIDDGQEKDGGKKGNGEQNDGGQKGNGEQKDNGEKPKNE